MVWTMGGDNVHVVGSKTKVLQHAEHSVGKVDAQHEVDLRHLLWGGAILTNETKDALLDLILMLHLLVGDEFHRHLGLWRGLIELAEGAVDGIHRRA